MDTRSAAALVLLACCAIGVTAQPQPQSALNRERAKPAYTRGLDSMRAEAWPEAEKAFREAIDIDPGFDLAYYWLGRVEMNMKKFTEALAAYQKARDVILAEAGRHFSSQQERLRYRQDRLTELDETIRQMQSGSQTGQSQERMRQLQEYRRQLVERNERGTTNLTVDATVPAFLSLALGSAYFRAEKFADAEREYKAAIAVDPKTGEAYNNLAVVYLQTGRADEAEKAAKSAEKAGFRVNPALTDAIAAAKKKTS